MSMCVVLCITPDRRSTTTTREIWRSAYLGVADQLKNLRELELRPNAIEGGHSFQELVREELPSSVFRCPHVDVPRSALLSSSVKNLLRRLPMLSNIPLASAAILRSCCSSRPSESNVMNAAIIEAPLRPGGRSG